MTDRTAGTTGSETRVVSSVTASTLAAGRADGSVRGPSWYCVALRAPFAARTWRAGLYTVVGALVALPGAILVVVSTMLGLGLAVTFLGLPFLALGGMAAIRLGALHRVLAARLLDQQVSGARPQPAGRSGDLRMVAVQAGRPGRLASPPVPGGQAARGPRGLLRRDHPLCRGGPRVALSTVVGRVAPPRRGPLRAHRELWTSGRRSAGDPAGPHPD
jgi:hypothetical protein